MDMVAPHMIGQKEASTDDNIREKCYNVVSISDLESMAPNLKIEKYLKNIKADTATKIILEEPEWLKAFNEIYTEENLQIFKDYIELININSAANYLSDDFEKISTDFTNKYYGTSGDMSQEDKAVAVVNGGLSMPLGKVYSEKYGSSQIKSDVEDMIKNIIYQNIRDLSDFYEEKTIEKLNSKVDKDEFACSPQTTNAFYNPQNNSITIPMSILKEPLYYPNGSKEQNYGAIGAIIAHEITHAFDNNGSKYDSDGNLKDWWTQEDYDKFNEKVKKVRSYYSTVQMDDGTYVNGDVTVGEDISDVGGFTCVLDIVNGMENPDYKAFFESFAKMWRDKYTQEALTNLVKFDEHPVGKVRANITLGQFEEFYRTYGITPNDKMYIKPEDRVQIW